MRRPIGLLLCALALLAVPAGALAHKGNPNYLSTVRSIDPATEGLSITVANRDDGLLVQNRSGKDVVMIGYNDEPYVRLDADGSVLVNMDSPAHYLNQERQAGAKVPAGVDGKGEPKWEQVSGTGRYEFHDHRMHWMGAGRPGAVKDESVRTKVFDWSVPMTVDGRPATVQGDLFWTPSEGGSAPVGLIVGLVALVLVLGILAVLVRRRRIGSGDDGPEASPPGGTPPSPPREKAEAW